MVTPKQAFSSRLYTDHLEEVEFLLSQVKMLFSDPEVPWPEIADFEERLKSHVDGLVLGSEDADIASAELLTSDDEDIIAGSAYALAHSKLTTALDAIVPVIVATEDQLLSGFFEGLRITHNDRIAEIISPLLQHDRAPVRAMAADILGYRREGEVSRIADLLKDEKPEVVLSSARALRRHNDISVIPNLRTALDSAGVIDGPEIALDLMILGDKSGSQWLIDFCSSKREDYGKAPLYLGLTGRVCEECCDTMVGIRGLGLCGSTGGYGSATERLLETLSRGDSAISQVAAESLMLIFGPGPTEERETKEEWIDIDGEIVDVEETVSSEPSTSADNWSLWIEKNTSELSPGRARNGKPLSIDVLLDEICNPQALYMRRQFAYLDLLMTTAPFQHFEADWPIQRQISAINNWGRKS